MKEIYLKSYIYLFGLIVILTLLISLLNYFIPFNSYSLKIIIPIVSMLIGSIILGKNTKEKAYLEGIKFSSIYIIILTIIKLIIKSSFNYKVFISYLVLIITGIIGSMIGINIKNK